MRRKKENLGQEKAKTPKHKATGKLFQWQMIWLATSGKSVRKQQVANAFARNEWQIHLEATSGKYIQKQQVENAFRSNKWQMHSQEMSGKYIQKQQVANALSSNIMSGKYLWCQVEKVKSTAHKPDLQPYFRISDNLKDIYRKFKKK